MKWSIQELFTALSYKKTYGSIFKKITWTPRRMWRRIKVFFFWLFNGYTKELLWDLNTAFLIELEFRITKFIKHAYKSYPTDFPNYNAWVEELQNYLTKLHKLNTNYYESQMTWGEPIKARIDKFTLFKKKYVDFNYEPSQKEKEQNNNYVYKQLENNNYVYENLSYFIQRLWD